MGKQKLLVIEDDPGLQKQLHWSFDGYDVLLAGERETALALVRRLQPAVVTMDLGLPPDPDGATEGLATLQQILALAPDTKVIILSGNQERAHALKAIALGAYDFHQKPFDADMLGLVIARAFYLHAMQQENRRMLQTQADSPLAGIVSRDPGMLKLCRSVEKVAPSSASVMLLGDSGSGKELIARGLHALSSRHAQRFVAINCAAIPENLLESELFGYERGAFTGAARQTLGKIELAHGGTFFLDEIGDMPLALQTRLLRVLEDRLVVPIGGEPQAVNVRIVSATHRNLLERVAEGSFREDLYYRLNGLEVGLPALRDRADKSQLLDFLLAEEIGEEPMTLSRPARQALLDFNWPGNVRQLRNVLRTLAALCESGVIEFDDLPAVIRQAPANVAEPVAAQPCELALENAEKSALLMALEQHRWHMTHTALQLGISRNTLYRKLRKHAIER